MGEGFEDADRGGADGDAGAVGGAGLAELVECTGGGFVPFGVHGVFGEVVALDGDEGARADVEGDRRATDAGGFELVEELGGEVESGGGGGDGAGADGVDGLVVLDIGGCGCVAVDVGGEWCLADALEEVEGLLRWYGADGPFAAVESLDGFEAGIGVALAGELFAGLEAGGGAEHDAPGVVVVLVEEEGFDAAAGGALAEEAGGDDAGVVEDEAIVGMEVLADIVEGAVVDLSGVAVEDEEAGAVAWLDRVLGDAFGGEVVLELVQVHGWSFQMVA